MFLENLWCIKCNKTTAHHNRKCSECSRIEYEEKERAWEAQHIETKLTNLRKRIEKLEQGPARF